ncbi:hypothetical protein [Streptomyces sedi]|uniref:Uncharacterized protein n=1 Tax=Streptomyces sedi TaxID=555059 RepID=A0A5C4UQB7_9ACTN|nr:hypothetical protein [Streptomyces sedi]TNM25871.1 hypothetical protein FH715_25990 [Streptomyces sedi]
MGTRQPASWRQEHYLRPGLHQADLDRFWLLRHQTATTLLDYLEGVETALAQATRSAAPPR